MAFPTETVFGLGADATSNEAVAKIYAAKGRPSFNPLIAHVADRAAAEKQGVFSAKAAKLAEAFWPGPLTLVLPLAPGATVCDLARAGLDSIALRVPSHPVAQQLLAAAGLPLAAPSANPSGRVSAVTAAHVREDFDGRIDAIIDGAVAVGLEFDDRLLSRGEAGACCGPAGCRAQRSRPCSAKNWRRPGAMRRSARRACLRPIMRRAQGCG